MTSERFDRDIRFFGKEGRDRLAASHVAVVGIGGLGTHMIQQLALLGVGRLTLIDNQELDVTNLNRYVGARHDDPIPGTLKVNIGERIVKAINPQILVDRIPFSLISKEAFGAIIQADYVFGCLDQDGLRLILNELCSAYCKPYIDLASEILQGDTASYGGRVCVAWDGQGCVICHGAIDVSEAQADLLSPEAKQDRRAIYGIRREDLSQLGPSVVSINGVVASLAITEFMLSVTGIRPPKGLLTYRGQMGVVTVKSEEPTPNCYYCKGIRGKGDAANTWRYIREGLIL